MIAKVLGGALAFSIIIMVILGLRYESLLTESAEKLTEAQNAVDKAKEVNIENVKTIKGLKEDIVIAAADLEKALETAAKNRKERDDANAKYDSYRKRMPAAMAKRGSHMALRSNNATSALIMRIETRTCTYGCDRAQDGEDSNATEPDS